MRSFKFCNGNSFYGSKRQVVDKRSLPSTTSFNVHGAWQVNYICKAFELVKNRQPVMENNNVLNDVGADDDEESVPDDEEDDDDEESEEEEEDVNIARRNDGVLEGHIAEPAESGKVRRLASEADIVRIRFISVSIIE